MKPELTPLEARVIGCLLEKQVTTPDQYPLSLNALTNACNQKSNRDPLTTLSEAEVQSVVDALVRKSLLLEKSGFGSRVPKYQQRFCNLEFSVLHFSSLELAVVTELLLRGPQTAGELRTRAARMAPVQEPAQVDAALENLAARTPQPCVVRLAREAGHRDVRWAQLFTGAPVMAVEPMPSSGAMAAEVTGQESVAARLTKLEEQLRQVRTELEQLRHAVAGGGAR